MGSKMFQTELENSCAAKPKLLDLFPNTQKVKEKGEEENTQKIKQFQSFHRGTMTAAVPTRYLLLATFKEFNQIVILQSLHCIDSKILPSKPVTLKTMPSRYLCLGLFKEFQPDCNT